jgi:hypothetical protein
MKNINLVPFNLKVKIDMRKVHKSSLFLIVTVVLVYPLTSMATLIDRGNNLIYDDTQKITWFDFAYDPGFDDWDVTEAWVLNLEYMGADYWRAPSLEELVNLGQNDFWQSDTYNADPFTSIGAGGEFYLTSSITGDDQRWAYSLMQDRTFATWPVASVYGVAVIEGDIANVPEPSAILLLAIGLLGIFIANHRISSPIRYFSRRQNPILN